MMAVKLTGAGMLVLGLAWGCASGSNPTVEAVRGEYRQASTDPQISQYAPLAIDDARKALTRLERAERGDAEETELNHLAYLARARLAVARSEAEEGALQNRVKTLGQERDRLLLEARSSEAKQAQREVDRLRAELTNSQLQRSEEDRLRAELAVQEQKAQTELAQAELAEQKAATDVAQAELEKQRAQAEQQLVEQKAEAERARLRAEQLQSQNSELQARETAEGIVLTMSDVLFATGRAELQPGARDVMARVAEYLNEFPDRAVAIAGHTDSVGETSYNQQLSERRANAVADLLRSRGVSADRMRMQGYGEERPVAPNENLAGRQQNRRVEIILENAPAAAPKRQGS